MGDAAIQPAQSERFDKCTRCLEPVPMRAARCPGCGQPHSNRRWVPLTIGVIGLFALVFVMGLMYYAVRQVDLETADTKPDEDSQEQGIMVKVPEQEKGKPAPPPTAEKKPPLNDK